MKENLKSPICEINPCGAGKEVTSPIAGKTYRVLFEDGNGRNIGWLLAVYMDEYAKMNDWGWHITDVHAPDVVDEVYLWAVAVSEAVDFDGKELKEVV